MRWYYGWNVVAVCMLFQVINWGIASFCFTFWVVEWTREFGASRGEVLLGMTGMLLMMAVSSPLAGWAMDRFSIRAFLSAGSLIFSLAMVLISQATAIWQITVIYTFVIGASATMTGPMAAQTLAAKWFRARRGFAIGVASTGVAAGGILMPPIVTALLLWLGWRGAFLALAPIPLLIIPLVWVVIRNTPAEKGIEPEPEAPASRRAESEEAEKVWTTGSILRDRGFIVIALALVFPCIAIFGVQQNLAPYSHDVGFSATTAASFVSMVGASMLVGKLLFGALCDRTDKRHLYWVAMGGMGVALAIMLSQPSSVWLMLVVSALIGIAGGSAYPLQGAILASRFGPKAFGRAMGLLQPFFKAAAVGPVLAGWMRDESGSYDLTLLIFLIGLAPAMLVMALFPKPEKPEPSPAAAATQRG